MVSPMSRQEAPSFKAGRFTLYTSDLHFGHSNIIKYENRPWETVEEMDKGLIENWNGVVLPEDDVYILGDFSLRSSKTYLQDILQALKGHKHLIIGNHDLFCHKSWVRDYFETITPYKEIVDNGRKVVMSHYPISCWNGQDEGAIHLYGHIHSDEIFKLDHPDAINVGADVHSWTPRTLDYLLKHKWEKS